MATVRYSVNPGDAVESVVVAAGAAVATKNIELTVEQAAVVTDNGTTRAIKRGELHTALNVLVQKILADTSLNE